MSKILKAAERSNALMAKFSATLSEADLQNAKTLPLMTATSLILAGAEKASSGELLPTGFNAVRQVLRRRFGVIEKLTKAS
jgi:hypothetical protein